MAGPFAKTTGGRTGELSRVCFFFKQLFTSWPPASRRRRRSPLANLFNWFVLAAALLMVETCVHPNPLFAQNDAPIVINTLSGLQFEGEYFTVDEINEQLASFASPAPGPKIQVIKNGLRIVFLNFKTIASKGDSRMANEISFDIDQRVSGTSPIAGTFIRSGPFNEYGHRTFTFGHPTNGRQTYIQGITKINPRYCELNTLVADQARSWPMSVATGTVPKSVIKSLVLSRARNPDSPNTLFDLALFFQQAGDYQQAEEELRQIEIKHVDLAERVGELREQNRQLYAKSVLNEIENRADIGQSKLAIGWTQVLEPTSAGLAGELVARLQAVSEREQQAEAQVESTRQLVLDLLARVKNLEPAQQQAVERFRVEIQDDLSRVTAPRLDAFTRLANDQSIPEQNKVSLALSGWLLGSNFVTENLAITESLFLTRDLIREYLTLGTDEARRLAILEQLKNYDYEPGAPEVIDAMIKQMKPIASPETLSTYTGQQPLEFQIRIPGTLADPEPKLYRCLAHLPPEYDPYRKYPLLLTLPGGAQPLEVNLNTWCGGYNAALSQNYRTNIRNGQAMRNGYIVVAVDWREPGQTAWGYTNREHRIVMDALYEAMRRFSVNSNRVFLSGHGVGGDGAYDVGLSHPEHWAGVLGFSGKFGKYLKQYSENSVNGLPLYCVNGARDFVAIGAMKKALNRWLTVKPSLGMPQPTVVHYDGRANEFFLEDLPEAFRWMNAQRRLWPTGEGFQFRCDSLRPGDSHFWFFEMYGIPGRNIVPAELYDGTKKFPELKIAGKISSPNKFFLEPLNVADGRDGTLWLSKDFVDFQETIVISGRGDDFKGNVKPSVKTLLDDYLRRADREHIYWGRIDCINGRWTVSQ